MITATIRKLSPVINNTQFRQVGILFLVSISNIIFGIATSSLLIKVLGAHNYGSYCLLINIFTFAQTFFLFGFFHSGSRLLALSKTPNSIKEYLGAELIILFLLFLIMTIALFIYGLLDLNLREKGLTMIFLFMVPIGWVFLLSNYFETLLQGNNDIRSLAKVRFWPKVYHLVGLLFIYFFIKKSEYILEVNLLIYFSSLIITYIIIIKRLSPSFFNAKERMKEILQTNKSYGMNIYLGSIFAISASGITGILISYFGIDNVGVGYFNLATNICAPLAIIPNILATTQFKDFAHQKSIKKGIFTITIIISLFTFLLICFLAKPLVLILYGSHYLPTVPLIYVLALGFSLYGFSDLFNRFLAAHGMGSALRNSSFIIGVTLLVANVALIKSYDVMGAAYSKLIAGIIYISCMFYYYKRYVRSLLN